MEAVKKEIDPLFRRNATTREELMALGREINARAGIPPTADGAGGVERRNPSAPGGYPGGGNTPRGERRVA